MNIKRFVRIVRVNGPRGGKCIPARERNYANLSEELGAINKDRLCLGACRRPVLSAVAAFVLQCLTQHAGERQVEEGAFWHLGRRLSGMQGHELVGTCLAHLRRRRRRYNIAIIPARLVERHERGGIDRPVFKEKLGSESSLLLSSDDDDDDRWSRIDR